MSEHKIYPDGRQGWYQNGKQHRIDGPAYIGADGYQGWWQNGKLHRMDGPARIWPDGHQAWYQNGKLHRVDGPARIWADGTQEWWVNDCEVITQDVLDWMEQCSIRPDWENWGDVEKIAFRLRF